MADDRTFTQEEVNKLVGQARLEGKEIGRKEFEGWISPEDLQKQSEELNAQISGLTDQVSALTNEKETLQTQLTEKDGTIAKYEIDSVKTRIARELGLSYEATEFLRGTTEDEIRQSAENLKGIVRKAFTPPAYNNDPAPSGDKTSVAWSKMAKDLFE